MTDHLTSPPSDDAPRACPRCAAAPMLFTPNARRDPYADPPIYEPAWQCTRCGHVEFIDRDDADHRRSSTDEARSPIR
jgi:hypothetical protein